MTNDARDRAGPGYFDRPEYLDYLLRNCSLSASSGSLEATCTRPDVSVMESYTGGLELAPGRRLLEVGCGLGRLLDHLARRHGVSASGVDVCAQAVELARERLPGMDVRHARAEDLPFPDATFDALLCWGVFDLTDQGRALAEMLRVLVPGGRLLLTGKNDLFMRDDEEALMAEVRSREKGIPNHYTDYPRLLAAIDANGGRVAREWFFLRRGDFMAGRVVEERPARFVEYCLLIERARVVPPSVQEICGEYSRSWGETHA